MSTHNSFMCTRLCRWGRLRGGSDGQVNGRVLLPGAAMLEASLAASRSFTDGTASHNAALAAISIPVPLILPEPLIHHGQQRSISSSSSSIPDVRITASALNGCMRMESSVAAGGWSTHLVGTASQLTALDGQLRQTGSQHPVALLLFGREKGAIASGPIGQLSGGEAAAEPAFRCHPASVDSSMHLALHVGHADGRTRVPGMGPIPSPAMMWCDGAVFQQNC